MLSQLKRFKDEQYSADILVKVGEGEEGGDINTELQATSMKEDGSGLQSTTQMEAIYMKAHALILGMYSQKLYSLLRDRPPLMNTIAFTVAPGTSTHLKLLMDSFYDQDVLNELKLVDILQVLKFALHLSCVPFVDQCVALIGKFLHSDTIPQVFGSIEQCYDMHRIARGFSDFCDESIICECMAKLALNSSRSLFIASKR